MNIVNHIIGAVVSAVVALTVVFIAGPIANDGSPAVGGSGRAYNTDVAVRSLTLATSTDADASNGSNDSIGFISEGTCNLSQSTAGSHAATTSKEYFCAYTGARSGDTIIVALPPGAGAYSSGAASALGGFVTNGNGYATTSNRVAVNLVNLTGIATSSFPQATTTAHILIVR